MKRFLNRVRYLAMRDRAEPNSMPEEILVAWAAMHHARQGRLDQALSGIVAEYSGPEYQEIRAFLDDPGQSAILEGARRRFERLAAGVHVN